MVSKITWLAQKVTRITTAFLVGAVLAVLISGCAPARNEEAYLAMMDGYTTMSDSALLELGNTFCDGLEADNDSGFVAMTRAGIDTKAEANTFFTAIYLLCPDAVKNYHAN